MSTRSNISVKVKQKDFVKVNEVTGYDMTFQTPYLQIYCHFDGYPEHMLYHELEPYFNDYESALNLVLAGDTSYISDGKQCPYTSRGESYESNKPTLCDKPSKNEEYLYVFENNRWKVY